MRVRICRLTDLQAGDEFYISDNLKDMEGNVYLAKSRFTVLSLKKKQIDDGRGSVDAVTKLFLRDEEGRDIVCGYAGPSRPQINIFDLDNIYKH